MLPLTARRPEQTETEVSDVFPQNNSLRYIVFTILFDGESDNPGMGAGAEYRQERGKFQCRRCRIGFRRTGGKELVRAML